MVYIVFNCSTITQVNGIMTTTLERLTSLRLMQVLAAAVLAALFIVASAGIASADGNYGGSANYPANQAPARSQAPPAAPRVQVVGQPSTLPVTGGDALGLAALGVGVVGAGAGLVVWSRRRTAAAANA